MPKIYGSYKLIIVDKALIGEKLETLILLKDTLEKLDRLENKKTDYIPTSEESKEVIKGIFER
jgi:hypothetical protein